uniref:Uncharacterized protein n=1 Tax=Siphoviridae sp. ctMCY8 TaxID=2827854 RepID=A0A8S5T9S7_9CAUD|nr:MAG TPA: hypothetical protein [Siphoviridae sp. ctMCY8]
MCYAETQRNAAGKAAANRFGGFVLWLTALF